MWYGYVGPGIKTVFNNYKQVEKLALMYPYSSYRKFDNEQRAWDWVSRQGNQKVIKDVVRYGNIFKEHYVTVEYFIGADRIYYNVRTKKLGYVKLSSDDPNVSIENRTELIKVQLKNIELNPDLILSHIIAIFHIVKMLGYYVDIEVVVPDHSVFYAITNYSGENKQILRANTFIKKRKGGLAVTLKGYLD